MKAVRYHEKGNPEVLQVDEIDIPVPNPGEVLIRVEFAGVNYGDVLQRGGGYYPIQPPLPAVPGAEVIGLFAVSSGTGAGWVRPDVTVECRPTVPGGVGSPGYGTRTRCGRRA